MVKTCEVFDGYDSEMTIEIVTTIDFSQMVINWQQDAATLRPDRFAKPVRSPLPQSRDNLRADPVQVMAIGIEQVQTVR